jgi:hypothetical protein
MRPLTTSAPLETRSAPSPRIARRKLKLATADEYACRLCPRRAADPAAQLDHRDHWHLRRGDRGRPARRVGFDGQLVRYGDQRERVALTSQANCCQRRIRGTKPDHKTHILPSQTSGAKGMCNSRQGCRQNRRPQPRGGHAWRWIVTGHRSPAGMNRTDASSDTPGAPD